MNPVARSAGKLTGIVLAAGGSTRLGQPKQLVRHRALPLLLHAVRACSAATAAPVIVVVGAEALRLRGALRRSGEDVVVVGNPRWRSGLAGSVRAGLEAVPRGAVAAMFVLTDQPHVDARSLERLASAWRRKPAWPAAALYSGRAGVPAIVPRRLWPPLKRLAGDRGARGVLEAAGARLTAVDMPEAAFDVDEPADLARLRGARGSRLGPAASLRLGPAASPLRSSPSPSRRRGNALSSRSARET